MIIPAIVVSIGVGVAVLFWWQQKLKESGSVAPDSLPAHDTLPFLRTRLQK